MNSSIKCLYGLAYYVVRDGLDIDNFLYDSLTEWEVEAVFANTPKLVNRKTADNYDFYIGRPTLFGNKYRSEEVGSKAEAIHLFTMEQLPKILKSDKCIEQLEAMRGKTIACWCFPEACHGEIILRLIRFRNILEYRI